MFIQVPWCEAGFSFLYMNELSDSDSDDDLILLYLSTKRSKWIYPINKNNRKSFGEYHHLMHDLEVDEDRFVTYFKFTQD